MTECLYKKAVGDITAKYGSRPYNEDALEIVIEEYYKNCRTSFCLDEKASIWKDVTENIING